MTDFVVALLAATIELSTPILLAAIGEIIAERAGVVNLGIEGIMLLGAFCGFWAVYVTEQSGSGLLAALFVGALMGLLMSYLSINLRADQLVSGLAIWILGIGLSTYLSRKVLGIVPGGVMVKGFQPIYIPVLSDVPFLGPVLFRQNVLVYLTLALVPLTWFVLFHTTVGLKIRSVGEAPRVADTLGINVFRIRYVCTILGATLAGLAGSYLTLARMFTWIEEVTAGRGWLAIVVVLFGRRDPLKALIGAWAFGVVYALQYYIQAMGLGIPYQVLLMLPYLVTAMSLIIITIVLRKEEAPAALGVPYAREEQ